MCIALISKAHPAYQLILIDNRDEYLNRPTAPAEWWPEPNDHVLAGHDLLRSMYGTWLGVAKTGRIAVLTNFREEGNQARRLRSRGAIINAFLTGKGEDSTTENFVNGMVASGKVRDVGGFTLVCGMIGEPLAVMSNRAKEEADVPWIGKERGQTVGLSNGSYGDRSWPKVKRGEMLMRGALEESVGRGESEDDLIRRLLIVLSDDTLPRLNDDKGLETYISLLRNTIFVPAVGRKDQAGLPTDEIAAARKDETARVLGEKSVQQRLGVGVSGLYGTQKQTVVLAAYDGRVRFFERTLYDNDVNLVPAGQGDRDFEFHVRN